VISSPALSPSAIRSRRKSTGPVRADRAGGARTGPVV